MNLGIKLCTFNFVKIYKFVFKALGRIIGVRELMYVKEEFTGSV